MAPATPPVSGLGLIRLSDAPLAPASPAGGARVSSAGCRLAAPALWEGPQDGTSATPPVSQAGDRALTALAQEAQGPQAGGMVGPRTAADQLVADVTLPLAPPILPRPAMQKRATRRRRSPIPNPRRSRRLATKTTATLNAVVRAQQLIMQKLGISGPGEEALRRYELSFERPLTQGQIEALTALAAAPGVKAAPVAGPSRLAA